MCALKLMFLKIFQVLEMCKKVTFHIKGPFDPLKSLSCFLMCFYEKQDEEQTISSRNHKHKTVLFVIMS